MKVYEYASNIIETRPYKYQTKQTLYKDLRRLKIQDLDIAEINSVLIRQIVEQVPTQSTRKRLYITCRSLFRELGVCQDLPYLQVQGRVYDLPSQEQLEWFISKSKYRFQLTLCMFAGLRVGEACAITPKKLEGNWLDINQAYSQDGMHLGSPKTYGKIMIPDWLAEDIRKMGTDDFWSLGSPTSRVTNSCIKISKNKVWRDLTGRKRVNPHMLRHWYATDMIRRGVSPEVVRRQMRHKNVSVTLQIYTQVKNEEIQESLPRRLFN